MGKQSSILIVDDDPSVRRTLSRKLSEEGYRCYEAGTGSEALDSLASTSFDVVILDVMMPGKSGVELLPEIKTMCTDVAVIMVTAVNDIDTVVRCVRAGAYDYLTKPFNLAEVSLSVERALEQKGFIAERRRLEQQAREINRLTTIGSMVAGIAHEMNNPLAAIMNYADLVLETSAREEARELVDVIKGNAGRASAILDKLLIFARQRSPERRNVDINHLLETTLDLVAFQLEKNHVAVSTRLAPDLPGIVADASQLQQVFLNIISNAESEITLAHKGSCLLVKTEAVDNIIRISITDDGPGIAGEYLTRIFDPFFTTKEVGKGAGLGLSVCYGIVNEHGGRIYAESELGKGATFVIELPVSAP